MKMNKWTVGLAAAGVVSLASTAQAEENSVLTSLGSTVLSGSVEASYVGSLSSDNNIYGENVDGFNANGASLSIGSPLGGEGYAAGYNVELLLGQRAADFAATGDGEDFLIKNANIGMSLPVGNGIDLTLGLFDTIVGYEVEASASNPNVSRSYGYDLEPFTHAGLLASTSLMDNVSLSLGVANNFDSTGSINQGHKGAEGNFGFLAGLEVTAPDSLGPLSGSTVYVGLVEGGDDVDDDVDDRLLYVGASIPTPIEGLSIGVAYDDRESVLGDAEATAFYATYGLSDTMNLALRYDTIEDDRLPGNQSQSHKGDTRSAVTATLGISLFDNVLTRIEYRAEDNDRFEGSSNGFAVNAFYSF
jgi:hypothetical protein